MNRRTSLIISCCAISHFSEVHAAWPSALQTRWCTLKSWGVGQLFRTPGQTGPSNLEMDRGGEQAHFPLMRFVALALPFGCPQPTHIAALDRKSLLHRAQ